MKLIDSEHLYKRFLDPDSIIVKVHDLVDFEYYRPILEPLYSDLGREAYDCIFMFKICILQLFSEGLSDRKIVRKIKTDMEYRYFLDMAIDDDVPHYTKVSSFRLRLGDVKFRELFESMVKMLKDNNIITKDDVRYMDATHQLADVAKVSVNTLLVQACIQAISVLENNSNHKYNIDIDLSAKDFDISDEEKKNRFVKLVELAQQLKDDLIQLHETKPDTEIIQAYDLLKKILRQRSRTKNGNVIRENSDEKGKIASITDKDATWGSKSKKKQFLGYKHNVTSTENGFIEQISTHKGHEPDEHFYLDDAKKCDCDKIVTDSKYGTLENRQQSKKLNIELVSPCRKNMKAHLQYQIMDDAFQYSHTKQYKEEMKIRGWLTEGIFGVMKTQHAFARALYRGLKKVSIQALITAFVINLKSLVKWYDLA